VRRHPAGSRKRSWAWLRALAERSAAAPQPRRAPGRRSWVGCRGARRRWQGGAQGQEGSGQRGRELAPPRRPRCRPPRQAWGALRSSAGSRLSAM
jgi:hypothetical protein